MEKSIWMFRVGEGGYLINEFAKGIVAIGHHLERPSYALREALRLAQVVIIIEPNGYNPGLKILEKTSPYDLGHEEKSYAPRTLNRWITTLGDLVTQRQ